MKNKDIDGGKCFDWGKTSDSYAKFRDIYPVELYERLRKFGAGVPGKSWLDLGTGTGILPLNLYKDGCKITGIDISGAQIEQAVKIAKEKKYNINFINCPAEETGLPEKSYDVITAAQCFMYFDKEKIVSEIKRIIKDGGLLIKIYMGWLKEEAVVINSLALVKKYNPNWLTGKPMIKDMKEHLFPIEAQESFYANIPFTWESWHGRIKATRGVEASMTSSQLAKFESEHINMLSESTMSEFTIKHKIFITVYKL